MIEPPGHLQAVQYARTHLCRFYSSHGAEVDRLMGCTLYRGRLHTSPYADLLSPALWDEFGLEFARQCCSLVGQVRKMLMPEMPDVLDIIFVMFFCFLLSLLMVMCLTTLDACRSHATARCS